MGVVRIILGLYVALLPSTASADLRATYGMNGSPAIIVDVKAVDRMRVTIGSGQDAGYFLWDGSEIFSVQKENGEQKIVRSVDFISAFQVVRERMAQIGYVSDSKMRFEPVALRHGKSEAVAKFSGTSFDLDVKNEGKPETFRFVSSADPKLKLLADASRAYMLREFDINHLPFTAVGTTVDSFQIPKVIELRGQYNKIYAAGAPLIWPNTDAKLMKIEQIEHGPEYYSLPGRAISAKALAQSMVAVVEAQFGVARK